jgi:hypothetical protein
MARGTVVLAGNLAVQHLELDILVAEFGWSLERAPSLGCLAGFTLDHNLIAVVFSPKNLDLPWEQALRAVLEAAPKALPILCHGFADKIDWPRMADAGAFHSLLLPFSASEFRQSLGFAWGAKNRAATFPTGHHSDSRKSICRIPQARAARIVA